MLSQQGTLPSYVYQLYLLAYTYHIDNLILKNPSKRPYLEKLKQEILNGDLDLATEYSPHKTTATCELVVASLANDHRLIFGALNDKERQTLVKRVSLAERYNCQKNSILAMANKQYDKKD
jgi:hypothetical protein